jgi:hypothetical protein
MLMYKHQFKGSAMKKYLQKMSYTLSAFMMALSVSLMALSGTASAAQITARKLTLSSSVASAVTTYTFSMTLPTATTVQSIGVEICTTASGACSIPSGFSVSTPGTAAVAPTGIGSGGTWTASNATPGNLRMANGSNTGAPSGTTTFGWSSVTNQSAANATFYARITTYSASGYTGALDTGTVAASTAGQITVTAAVDETLTFTLASATVALGTLTTGAAGSGTSTMTASTNGQTGYAISVNGTTLTASSGTIPAYTNAASSPGTAGFGINLVSNSTPSVGANVSGSGTGIPSSSPQYDTTNTYRFATGEIVASASAASNTNTYTVSYVANISPVTPAGAYSTALTYIATATF